MVSSPQAQQQMQQQQQQQSMLMTTTPQPPQPPLPELDAEQKQALLQAHVGDLIPGERVIMFLTNLLHVSDSSSSSTGSNSSSTTTTWCCAMTYYRLLLFATHPVTPPPKPAAWNHGCWPSSSTQNDASSSSVWQMPLATMDRVEKSVFTVSNGSEQSQ